MAKSQNGFIKRLGTAQVEPPWSLSEVGLTLAVLALGMLLIAPVIATVMSDNSLNPDSRTWLLAWSAGLVIVGGFVLLRWRRSSERFNALKLGAGRFSPFMMMLLGVGGAFIADLVAFAGTGILASAAPLHDLNPNAANILIALLLMGVIMPLVDSLIFFGVVLPRLRATLSAYAGLALTALLYAAYHALVYGARLQGDLALWFGFVMPLVAGLIFAVVRVWDGSTRSTAVANIAYGVTVVLILFAV